MTDLTSAYQHLGRGVLLLATHPGRIKDRLLAASSHFAEVTHATLPESAATMWHEQVWIKIAGRGGLVGTGVIESTIEALPEEDAVQVAEAAVEVTSRVAAALDKEEKV